MARKKKPEEHENHERWLISYADFITLLFAFFVVMYSVSSVNEGKYRVVARSMIAAFGSPVKSLSPVQMGELVRAQPSKIRQQTLSSVRVEGNGKVDLSIIKKKDSEDGNRSGEGGDRNGGDIREAARQIQEALKELIEKELVEVRIDRGRLEVEIRSSVLFASGSGEVTREALPVLESIADILADLPNIVHVEGFTDNVPISTFLYPSNWELSAKRSARVVRHLIADGIEPRRLVSVGYGEYHPVASNATPEGRARNRRVVLVVQAEKVDPESTGFPGEGDHFHARAGDIKEVLAAATLKTEPPANDPVEGALDFKLDL